MLFRLLAACCLLLSVRHAMGQRVSTNAVTPGIVLPTYFSGSDCELTVGTGNVPLYPSNINTSTLKIEAVSGSGDSHTFTHDFTDRPPIERPSIDAFHIRFASTHFSDGAVIKVTYTINENLPRTQTVNATATIYNKGLTLATREKVTDTNGDGILDGFAEDSPPAPDGYATAAQAGAALAKSNLIAMNHAWINTKAPELMLEADLAPLMKTATALFLFTHGSDRMIRSSLGEELIFRPTGSETNEVLAYVQTGRTMPQLKAKDSAGTVHNAPGPNIVIIHGCWTWVNQNVNIAFNQTPSMTAEWQDRCYAGFDDVVWSLNNTTHELLSTHAQDVYERLLAGDTMKKAIAHANSTHPAAPQGGFGFLPMKTRGDLNARLINVYTGHDPDATDTWCKELS